jgi:signal transduction histidine kinase
VGDAPVELRLARRPGAWRIEVADSGGGIPAGEEERLFRPFNRGRTRSPGSGLGLAIVRGIAEAHGGSAGVDNRPGDGATFWIEVPG